MGAKNVADELTDGFRGGLSRDEIPVRRTLSKIACRVLKDLVICFAEIIFAPMRNLGSLAERTNDRRLLGLFDGHRLDFFQIDFAGTEQGKGVDQNEIFPLWNPQFG